MEQKLKKKKTVAELRREVKKGKQSLYSTEHEMNLRKRELLQELKGIEQKEKQREAARLREAKTIDEGNEPKPSSKKKKGSQGATTPKESSPSNISMKPTKRKIELEKKEVKKLKKVGDFSSPEEVFYLLNIEPPETPPPPKKLASNKALFSCVGRNEQFKAVAEGINERFRYRKGAKERKEDEAGRLENPLIALHASPGVGKSFFLDEIAKREPLFDLLDDGPQKIIRDSISICVTYNGMSTSTDQEKEGKITPITGLALRIIWSSLCQEISWDDFMEGVGVIKLTLGNTIKFISKRYNRPILLCVDELMKSPKPFEILTAIGERLNAFGGFNAVVSTLELDPVTQVTTKSGRPIHWVKMTPIPMEESFQLFEGTLASVDKNQRLVIRACISDCNGHGRSLENLAVIFKERPHCINDSYTEIINGAADKCAHIFTNVSFEMVALALLGNPVSLRHQVHTEEKDSLKTVDECISHGFYLNSLVNNGSTVPSISPLILRVFSRQRSGEVSNVGKVSKAILEMLKIETNFHAVLYERFHANWEILIRLIKDPLGPLPLFKFYGLEDKAKSPVLKILPKHGIKVMNTRDLKTNDVPVDFIVQPASTTNPGYDLLFCEHQENGQLLYIAVQCKWSYVDAATTLQRSHIEKAWEATKRELKAIPEKQLFFVVCAWRNTTKELETLCDVEGSRILVLNRSQLERIYSPTLTSRPQFLLSLKQ